MPTKGRPADRGARAALPSYAALGQRVEATTPTWSRLRTVGPSSPKLSQGREYILHDADKVEAEPDSDAEGPAIGAEPLDISFELPAGALTGRHRSRYPCIRRH